MSEKNNSLHTLFRTIKLINIKTKHCDNYSNIWRREIVDGVGYFRKSVKRKRTGSLLLNTDLKLDNIKTGYL